MAIKAISLFAAIMTHQYGSRQKEVAVWFQACQRSASILYQPIVSHIKHCLFRHAICITVLHDRTLLKSDARRYSAQEQKL